MKLCRFRNPAQDHDVHIGLWQDEDTLIDLTAGGLATLTTLLENPARLAHLHEMVQSSLPAVPLRDVQLQCPVEGQEIWAAGVTYQRSKKARMEESDFSANAYDRVYDAPRPEIFFKSLPEKIVGPGGSVGIRRDAKWNVPEPELALVINSQGRIMGYTIGNDMSSRDIEGENLLYLPQAKVYDRSCAIGPCLVLDTTEDQARKWSIAVRIEREGLEVFSGETSIDQIKRPFTELAEYLCRSQSFPKGAILLTGTGVVPDDDFTLQNNDVIKIEVSGIGTLENKVVTV